MPQSTSLSNSTKQTSLLPTDHPKPNMTKTNSFIKPIEKTHKRININDRRIIGGNEESDVVQLSPMKHKFAWDYYETGNANHWLPTEISMQRDIELWKDPQGLTPDERHAFKRVMGFFTTGDSS